MIFQMNDFCRSQHWDQNSMAETKEDSSTELNEIHHMPHSDLPLRSLPPLAALLAFERAAAQLSFRRAAVDLALSPSAISHQIRNLEAQFGVKLFARDRRSVRLTAEGERFRRQVSTALTALERACRDMRVRRRVQQDEVWISSLPFFTSTVLVPALPTFERDNPGITLRIEATHQYADFAESGVDLAIRFSRQHAVGLKLEPLIKVIGIPVCAPQLIKAGLRAPADLAGEVLIHLTRQPRTWPAWLAAAGVRGLTPRGNLWLDTVPSILDAVEHGAGVALAMDPLIRAHPGFGKKLAVPFESRARQGETIYLVSRREQARDARLKRVRRWITQALQRALAV
jgi:LysR family transcriptional regulator, glycine cleavage system transcriptional activator